MRFKDVRVERTERFAIGIDLDTNRFYVSIPVSNRLADYEEYYEVSKEEFDRYIANPQDALPLVQRCRQRLEDARLLIPPGADRGTA
jgi:hypothetical protein